MTEQPPKLTIGPPNASQKIPALTLVAHSIAQQRQTFIHGLTFNPMIMTPYFIVLGIVCQRFYTGPGSLPTILIIICGFAIAGLNLARNMAEGYLDEAGRVRSMGMKWWEGKREAIVAVFGTEVVGVIAFDENEGKNGVEIVAWTVRIKYRRKGLGRDLLEKAVERARKKYGSNAKVTFAKNHANSLRIASPNFHKHDVRRDKKAQKMLDSVLKS